jgi:electron transfer flavoprotein alpha subunit
MSRDSSLQKNGILIVGECAKGIPVALVFELLGLGRRLGSGGLGEVSVALLGNPAPEVFAALFAGGAERIFVARTTAREHYESDVWLAALAGILARTSPGLILAGHTALGADLAPRLAFRLKAAIATGCERLVLSGDKLHATRPCFGHKAREDLALKTQPSIVTVRAKTHEAIERSSERSGEVVEVAVQALDTGAVPRVTARKYDDAGEGPRLESANVVVAGGRGLGGAEGFETLGKLANILGGAVGATRVACDLGWCPRSWQVGLTGKTVTPSLYVAVGISGASHHMAGCGNASAILAINSDPEAPIFKEARFGLVGDYRELVPALVTELARHKTAA